MTIALTDILAALAPIAAPGGRPLRAMVGTQDVHVSGGTVSVAIPVAAHEAGAFEAPRLAAEAALAKLPGVTKAW